MPESFTCIFSPSSPSLQEEEENVGHWIGAARCHNTLMNGQGQYYCIFIANINESHTSVVE